MGSAHDDNLWYSQLAREREQSAAQVAYNIFRGGFRNPNPPPHWDELEPWVREAVVFSYRQGQIAHQQSVPKTNCPYCGATPNQAHDPNCGSRHIEPFKADR